MSFSNTMRPHTAPSKPWSWLLPAEQLPYNRPAALSIRATLSHGQAANAQLEGLVEAYCMLIADAYRGTLWNIDEYQRLQHLWADLRRTLPTRAAKDGVSGLSEFMAFLLDLDLNPTAQAPTSPLMLYLRAQAGAWRFRIPHDLHLTDEPYVYLISQQPDGLRYEQYPYSSHDDSFVWIRSEEENEDGDPITLAIPLYLASPAISIVDTSPFLPQHEPYSLQDIFSSCLWLPNESEHPAIRLEYLLLTLLHQAVVPRLALEAVQNVISKVFQRFPSGETFASAANDLKTWTFQKVRSLVPGVNSRLPPFQSLILKPPVNDALVVSLDEPVIKATLARLLAKEFASLCRQHYLALSELGSSLL